MATVDDVAAAIMERLSAMTAMKLEKLVYYCQCWYLAEHNSPLFDEPIEAWREGPVVPALYQRHRKQLNIDSWPFGDPANLAPKEKSCVEWVTDKYGDFSAVQLSRMTHSELPWRAARIGLPDNEPSKEKISRELIRNFYGRQRANPEAAVVLATASAALEGADLDQDWQDQLRDVASGVKTADDLIAEEIARFKGV